MTFLVYTSADSPGFERLYALYRSVFPDPDEAEDLPGIKASLELRTISEDTNYISLTACNIIAGDNFFV